MSGPGASGGLIDAATVLPLRDAPDGFEILMLRKNSKVAFGGMWVFPGGKVDDVDVDPARPGNPVAAAARAAAREALEEADLVVDAAQLVPFSHWTPPEDGDLAPKRFATWFFACRAPSGTDGDVTIDGGEIQEDRWVRPQEMLDRHHAGEVQLVPPTVVTLHELAARVDVHDVLEQARNREPLRYASRLCTDPDGTMVILWAGDAGYETGDPSATGPRHRARFVDRAWRFERR